MSDEVKKFFSTYGDFVKKVTSEPSLDLDALKQSLEDVESKSPIESARLMTAALGLGSETGEFVEIVKKNVFTRQATFRGKHISYEKRTW